MSLERRRQLIEPEHPQLSIVRQCGLVSISRSGFYHRPFGETPWYGSRQMARHLCREGYAVGRKRVRRLMAKMGLAPIYQRPRTTSRIPSTGSFPTCCGTWWSTGRTRSGAPTSPTCRCGAASSSWSR